MRKLILISTLLLFILASCDSGISDVDNNTQNTIQPGDIPTSVLSDVPPAKADSVRKAVFQQFKARHGSEWKISWNEKTGMPLSVFSGTTEPTAGSPQQAARTFLVQNRSLFGMKSELSDLQLKEIRTSRDGIRHVRFQQTHKGVPVYNGTYQVHIRPDGRIDMANGHYYPGIEAPSTPGVSAASAQQTALADLGAQVKLKREAESTLMVYRAPENKNFTLAWKIQLRTGAPAAGLWQFFVDAGNGQVLSKLNMATTITGDGDIIEDNPDDTPTAVNKNFPRLDGSGYLRGTYANVHNDEASRAFSSNNSFQYSTTNTHFDESNVYYHIDTFRNAYLNTIGFAGKDIGSDQDLEAHVHDQEVPNNARYIPGSGNEEVRFGDAVGFAKADKIIYHEFTHAMADAENGSYYFDPNPSEEGAIGEGLSDYLPGSFTDEAKIGTSVTFNFRDMESPSISSFSQYENERDNVTPVGDVEEHEGGEFFSAILWDLRNGGGISTQTADELVFEAISRVSSFPNFLEYRDAMMAADAAAFGGVHEDLIQDTFAARGVGNPVPPPPPNVTISGPTNFFEGQSGTFTTSASGGNPPYSYQWYYKNQSDTYWILATGETSTSYNHTAGPPSGGSVRIVVTDSYSSSNQNQQSFTIIGQN